MSEQQNPKLVLFVDDEQSILSSLKRALRKEPYTSMFADNAAEALKIVSEQAVNVVISDQRMPDMDGTDFLQQVKEINPFTVRAILSGYVNADVVVESINKGEVYRFIPKPWELDNLKDAINQCLKHNEVLLENSDLICNANARVREFRSQKSELENTVVLRNMILEYTQEMLEYMPVSVLGVSQAGEILICNEHARTSITELNDFHQGDMLQKVFYQELWDFARESLVMHLRVHREFPLKSGSYGFEFIPLLQSRINGLLIIINRI